MNGLSFLLEESEEFNRIVRALRDGQVPISITGTDSAQRVHLVYSALKTISSQGALFITGSEETAQRACEDFSFFTKKAVYLPSRELIFRNFDAVGRETTHQRMNTLMNLSSSEIVVLSIDSLLSFVVPKSEFDRRHRSISVGDVLSLDELAKELVEDGYERVDTVEGMGQFAIRGGIVDIYSPSADLPHRFELFGDEVDSVREFDPISQISGEKKESFQIIACTEAEANGSLLSYIPDDWHVVLDQPQRIRERADNVIWEANETCRALAEKGDLSLEGKKLLNDYSEIMDALRVHPIISLSVLSHAKEGPKPKTLSHVTGKIINSYGGNPEFLFQDLVAWKKNAYRTIVLSGSRRRGEELQKELEEREITATFTEKLDTFPPRGSVVILPGSVSKGFMYPLINTVVVSDKEIFPAERKKRRKTRPADGKRIQSYTELEIGDFVVHRSHGIGKYIGIRKMTVQGVEKDYLQIKYRGEEFLYVPVGQMDSISKFSGGEGKEVRLNKLGGVEWNNTKARVRQSVKALAFSLVELYAQRSQTKGHAFSEDTLWQREFEETFLYEETEDQLHSIAEMKRDMESSKPMDRLLCGDVGYGKTEVAIRGAFKCVMDSMQVAHLVPTTILAMQHYNTYIERMKDYPIRIEMLSRFRTPAAQKRILKQLQTGEVDIVIGTHKILQDSVKFKNLGLLIVDEEQRFGVGHKEKIKNLKKDVDVLTLSATPIPRTLHMSMVGIRDMSVLTEPPEERYPVETYVMEHDMGIVMEAIRKETPRGGQVYYLHNRIDNIYNVAESLQSLMPELTVRVAHGRMREGELEKIMMEVLEGNVDVLVCTTIIETGLDISNVNTIIIEDADRMGLSQLHQLRGRVGRSNRKAFAYLTYRKNKVLDEISERRLRAICEFTEFGAGFKIAMRDLEIRGAGNLLGPEQHGFIDAVGYDVYCSILDEAIREVQGLPPAETKEDTLVDLSVSAYIPESYIKNGRTRIELYKKIAGIQNIADRYSVEEELEDRFGDPPNEVRRLIDVSFLRVIATECGISEISQSDDRIIFKFSSENPPDIRAVSAVIAKRRREKILFSASDKPYISCPFYEKEEKALLYVKNILKDLKDAKE